MQPIIYLLRWYNDASNAGDLVGDNGSSSASASPSFL